MLIFFQDGHLFRRPLLVREAYELGDLLGGLRGRGGPARRRLPRRPRQDQAPGPDPDSNHR